MLERIGHGELAARRRERPCAVPGSTMRLSTPMYSGSMAESASPVARACDQRALRAGQPEDGGDGELDAGRRRPAAALDLLGHRHALVDRAQSHVVSRLEAQVEELSPASRSSRQVVGALVQQVLGVGVAAHALEARQLGAQQREDLAQAARARGRGRRRRPETRAACAA